MVALALAIGEPIPGPDDPRPGGPRRASSRVAGILGLYTGLRRRPDGRRRAGHRADRGDACRSSSGSFASGLAGRRGRRRHRPAPSSPSSSSRDRRDPARPPSGIEYALARRRRARAVQRRGRRVPGAPRGVAARGRSRLVALLPIVALVVLGRQPVARARGRSCRRCSPSAALDLAGTASTSSRRRPAASTSPRRSARSTRSRRCPRGRRPARAGHPEPSRRDHHGRGRHRPDRRRVGRCRA